MITLSYYLQFCVYSGVDSFLLASSDRMYRLAPWIMLFIALYGIGRLLEGRRGAEESPSPYEPEQDSLRNDEEDESYEDDGDGYDDYEEEE